MRDCMQYKAWKVGMLWMPGCRHAAKLNITLVTITQRAALLKYHSVELRLVDGEGDWQLRAIVPEDS